jgi:hypothetical protein
VSVKIKRETIQKEGQEIPEVETSPKDMEVDDIIEEPNYVEQRMIESITIVEELDSQSHRYLRKESVTLHHMLPTKKFQEVVN